MDFEDSDVDAAETMTGVARVAVRLFAFLVLAIIVIVFLYAFAAEHVTEFSVSIDDERRPKYAAAAGYAVQRMVAEFDLVNEPGEVRRVIWNGDIWANGVLRGHRFSIPYIVEYKVHFAEGEDVENRVTRIEWGDMDVELPEPARTGFAAPLDQEKLARLATAESRDWRNTDGEVFIEKGRLVYEFQGRVRIAASSSDEYDHYTVHISKFSPEDQAYIKSLVHGEGGL